MELSALWADEDAQSEVLGAVLMVGVVVALAGLAATAVFSLDGSFGTDQPRAEFAFAFDESSTSASCSNGDLTADRSPSWGELTVTHDGGAAIDGTQLTIRSTASGEPAELAADCSETRLTPGSSASVLVDSDGTVLVVWRSQDGETTVVLDEWTGPDV